MFPSERWNIPRYVHSRYCIEERSGLSYIAFIIQLSYVKDT